MNRGKSIRLFLVEGSIGGLLTAEIGGWTGHVMAAPRSKLMELLKRKEASKTGVYILLGDSPSGDVAYIGEGDAIETRLRRHYLPENKGGKDFWNRVIVLTSKDDNLTKAHVRYLESRFITLANEAKRAKLDNGNKPDPIGLPESDQSDMEEFISLAQVILPVLDVNLLRSKSVYSKIINGTDQTNNEAHHVDSESPKFEIKVSGVGMAYAQELDGEFTVLEGSVACSTRNSTSGSDSYFNLWLLLKERGVLKETDNQLIFSQNYVFSSPSAAAAVIKGGNRNGRTSWKIVGTSTTYADWQVTEIEEGDK